MTAANDPTVREYERRAEEAEHSPLLALLKVGRVVVWVVYALALVDAVLLTVAFFLHLAGANPDASFVEWVYRSTERAMRPFRGIFPTQDVGGSSVLDLSYLIAAIVYLVIALLVDGVQRWLTARLRQREREARQARGRADSAAERALAQQQAADQAARLAAAREYADQQAAAQQYTIARAAAQEALARQGPAPPAPSPPAPAEPTRAGPVEQPPPPA
ncbi:MAG TPA: YggT family protein [Acidimicrobiales bacterium]